MLEWDIILDRNFATARVERAGREGEDLRSGGAGAGVGGRVIGFKVGEDGIGGIGREQQAHFA